MSNLGAGLKTQQWGRSDTCVSVDEASITSV